MSNTLIYKDTIQRIGYTIIDNEKVVQYSCTIDPTNPDKMKVISAHLNEDLYKAHRDVCRADWAEFEDAAYALQEEFIAKAEAAESDNVEE